MYNENPNQLVIATEMNFCFTVILDKDNRWCRMADMINWDLVDDVYRENISVDVGRHAHSSRLAFTCAYVRAYLDLTMEETLAQLHENMYIAHFAGANQFSDIPDISKSEFEAFLLRFPVEGLSLINDNLCIPGITEPVRNVDRNDLKDSVGNITRIASSPSNVDSDSIPNTSTPGQSEQATSQPQGAGSAHESDRAGKAPAACGEDVQTASGAPDGSTSVQPNRTRRGSDQKDKSGKVNATDCKTPVTCNNVLMMPEKPNKGTLIMDATAVPQDMKYPVDVDLLNQARQHLEKAIGIIWLLVPHEGKMLPYSSKVARKKFLEVSKARRCSAQKMRTAVGEQLRYVDLAYRRYQELRALVDDIKFPKYLEDRLRVIPTLYAQQKEMYDEKKHTCEDRIVSLSQPFVRPIYRGKKPNTYEFGQKLHLSNVDGYTFLEQTSWSNFNESLDLIDTVEAYKKRHGYYPEAVLADEIYRTKQNRAYCKERGIRLTGKPLGRPKKDPEETKKDKQIAYEDSCKRNAIEGRNGNLKRRYSLGRIMCRLDETAKSEACLDIIAMNVRHKLKLEDEQRKTLEAQKWA